jgi:hypothetical protein
LVIVCGADIGGTDTDESITGEGDGFFKYQAAAIIIRITTIPPTITPGDRQNIPGGQRFREFRRGAISTVGGKIKDF